MNPPAPPSPRPRFARLLPGLLLAALAAACGGEPPPPEPFPPWQEQGDHRWRELRVEGSGEGFTALGSGHTGVDVPYEVSEDERLDNRILAEGSGVAVGDVDGDGRPDLYVTRPTQPNGLFLNRGGMRFVEATEEAGLALEDHRSTGTALADVDGDGDLDLLVAGLGDPVRLFLGDGSGGFTDVTGAWGFETARGSKTLALADVDGNGTLDLYVSNYKRRTVQDRYPPERIAFDSVVRQREGRYEIAPEFREEYRLDRDGEYLRRFELGEPDEFYLNTRDSFRAVSFTGGAFRDPGGEPLEEEPRDWGLVVRFGDMDRDGDQDIYVCDDFLSPDRVYMNQGDGTFRRIEPLALRATSFTCMAVAYSDVDADGGTEIFTSDMRSRRGPERRRMVRRMYPERPSSDSTAVTVQEKFNTLNWRRADGTWSEVGRHAGVSATGWTWGASFLDADLDGREDLFMATGHRWDVLDGDLQRSVSSDTSSVDWRRRLGHYPSLPLPNAAFRATGEDLRFDEVSDEWGFAVEDDIAHGLAPTDLDGDGDLDMVVTRWGGSPTVYRNESTAPRVAVRLVGTPPNTDAVGARVEVRGPGLPPQSREVGAGGLYLSDGGPTLSFAAGEADTLQLAVRWPDGSCTGLPLVPGRLYEVRQPSAGGKEASSRGEGGSPDGTDGCPAGGLAPGPPAATSDGGGGAHGTSTPMFRDRTAELGHEHVDRPFEDFDRQPLVPYRLSELGPGVSWQDLDGDGWPELVVPAGRGGQLAVFSNRGGELVRRDPELDDAVQDQTTALAVPGPGGGGGAASDLLVGTFAYETSSPAQIPAVRRIGLAAGGARTETAVPGARSAAGPLALADVDGDGDLDLFVGHRAYGSAYPVPPNSRMYRNEDGRFVADDGWSSALQGTGMVTSALFTDLEGDGWPDLVLATEWGPIRVFRNDSGRLREATGELGLDDLTGRWNGLAAGDLDGDGRPDLVATSWGTNTEYGRVTPGTDPLLAYFGLFDDNSSLDVLLARRDTAVDGPAPLRGWEWLRPTLPGIRSRVENYEHFSGMTVDDLLGLPREGVSRLEARELRHLVLLNRGGSFEARPLPMEAQIAPAFGVAVTELDGDGREDVVLTQNLSGVPPGQGPYRAGRSLWLKGDGSGGFEALPDSVSALGVYGDGRGLAVADYDGDGRTDVAVGQHRRPTRLFRNVGAEPGLRVRLEGPPSNPNAVGASIRVVYADGSRGPAREVRAGGSHWSAHGPVQVMGLAGEPEAVWVRWPGGEESEVAVPAGAGEVTATVPAEMQGG